jgi:hypothetical protein
VTRAALGSLDKVKRVVKVLGMVNSAPGFSDQPKVLKGDLRWGRYPDTPEPEPKAVVRTRSRGGQSRTSLRSGE